MNIRRFQAGATAVAAAALALGAILPAAVPAAAAVPKVSYKLWLDDSCISGKGPASTALIFDLRRPSGRLVESLAATTDPIGAFDGCFRRHAPRTGLTLIARRKSTVLRTIILPRLTVKSDRVTDKVTVGAAPGKRIVLSVSDCNSSLDGCSPAVGRTGTIGDKGTWTTDLTAAYDARGHDPIEASFKQNGDTIHRSARFPYLGTGGATDFFGSSNPGSTVKVRLKDAPDGTLLATVAVTAGPTGSFYGQATLLPGRELSADFATDARITIPTTSLSYNEIDNAFVGTCLPDRPMAVYWWDGQGAHGSATADSLGTWSIDLDAAAVAAPAAGTDLIVTCNAAAGDQVTYDVLMPS